MIRTCLLFRSEVWSADLRQWYHPILDFCLGAGTTPYNRTSTLDNIAVTSVPNLPSDTATYIKMGQSGYVTPASPRTPPVGPPLRTLMRVQAPRPLTGGAKTGSGTGDANTTTTSKSAAGRNTLSAGVMLVGAAVGAALV